MPASAYPHPGTGDPGPRPPRRPSGRLRAWRRGVTALLVALVAAAGASACGGGEPGEARASITRVRFGLIQSIDQVPFMVMQEQRYAEREGIDLVEEVVSGGRAAVEAIEAGTLDVAYAGSLPFLSAARRGAAPGRVLAVGAAAHADRLHPSMTVLAAPSVRDWQDLAGRDIGVNQIGSLGEVATRIRLREEGVEGTRFVEIDFPNLGLALAGGNIAAAVVPEPFTAQSALRGDGHTLGVVIGGAPFPEIPVSFIVVRAALARDHPEVVEAFLRAHLAAVEWTAGHEREARSLMARRLGIDDQVAGKMELAGLVADARVDPTVWATVQATLFAADPALTPVPLDHLYDGSFLARVLKERRG